ncbi:sugar ABC transporter ATP-binding protein [Actinorhabdospora filicis]|uniref:Sugar ABC transporter ATP-binding protein n=1 Tax=Actinorhabdospora filicis TaxID=1785913 RepID=A0A9W6W3P8_9ACTN|nr:sugar ABC transporter ATP-binding protein [Actinorhabdospora filicis]GLZ78397.1 sugar ABC transporter ATP-binding protein [Actinorhabdospora filicis]
MNEILRLTDVVKTFPGVRALDGVHLSVARGEVHCLLGQNGAGKSTLIKILSGAHRPDSGRMDWQGTPVAFAAPMEAMRAGIATIYQELDLVDHLSIAENVYLGHEPRRAGFVRRAEMLRRTDELLARFGHAELDPARMVHTLPAAGRQLVSIARALSHEARLIVMDEPTAVLAHDEVANLMRVVRELTALDIAVIYITHRLEEIREIGDRVTVLKDGRSTATGLPADTPARDLVTRMTGRAIDSIFPARPTTVDAPALLTVSGLTRRAEFTDVSLSVAAGEIVGITGLVGSGRSELLETIAGARRADSGAITLDGRPVRGGVPGAVRAGLVLAPEERKSQALILGEPVYRNMTLAALRRFSAAGLTRPGRERAAARALAERLQLRPPDVERPVGTLSGGNQQKVVLGRWLLGHTRLLLLDEPTRGVDAGARAELYQLIRDLAADGLGVLMVSSEVPECLGLADRVLVMRAGRIVHTGPAEGIDEEKVLELAMGGK